MSKYFTYLIGWTKLDKWYYGVRYAEKADPSCLWDTYFTSSKTVFGFRKLYGEPDVIKIRKIFAKKESAFIWEQSVLRRLKIPFNNRWLNKNVGGFCGPKKSGKGIKKDYKVYQPMLDEKNRLKLSETRKRRGLGKKSAKYLKPQFGDKNPMRNPVVLDSYKKRITGRKREYNKDGSWFWSYKNKAGCLDNKEQPANPQSI
jgi:hypothetical protein